MKIGITDIKNTGYGMLQNHMLALAEVAEREDRVMAFRNVNKQAAYFLAQGCPTKSLKIKAKSAENGIAAGTVPIDPDFGRPIKKSDYEHHRQLINDAKKSDSSLQEIPLILAKDRILNLKEFFQEQISITENAEHIFQISWDKLQEDHTIKKISVSAIPLANENYLSIDKKTHDPVLVLGKNNQMVTTDYDLLFIGKSFKAAHFSHAEIAPVRTQSYKIRNGLKEKELELVIPEPSEKSKSILQKIEALSPRKQSESAGNLSDDTKNIIAKCNQAIGLIDHKRSHPDCVTIHHGTEMDNPYACDIKNDLPCLIIFAHDTNLQEMSLFYPYGTEDLHNVRFLLIETADELKKLHAIIRDEYYINTHAKHTSIIEPFRKESIAAVEKAVAQKLKVLNKQKENNDKVQLTREQVDSKDRSDDQKNGLLLSAAKSITFYSTEKTQNTRVFKEKVVGPRTSFSVKNC